MKTYRRFQDFYPFYLSQHENRTCRTLHVIGSLSGLSVATYGVVTGTWWMLLPALVLAYGFAWVGHFVFEKNVPATFTYPLYSFMGDWVMLAQILTGRLPTHTDAPRRPALAKPKA